MNLRTNTRHRGHRIRRESLLDKVVIEYCETCGELSLVQRTRRQAAVEWWLRMIDNGCTYTDGEMCVHWAPYAF